MGWRAPVRSDTGALLGASSCKRKHPRGAGSLPTRACRLHERRRNSARPEVEPDGASRRPRLETGVAGRRRACIRSSHFARASSSLRKQPSGMRPLTIGSRSTICSGRLRQLLHITTRCRCVPGSRCSQSKSHISKCVLRGTRFTSQSVSFCGHHPESASHVLTQCEPHKSLHS